ncbi:hypothetical protein SteCoe_38398 [Stentor coeruleus]|uniref:IBR domain-containing protein n=1 Tax=Stentor coeruleus TaxID=5963 RepID=A0A1R2ALG5_9CILI|nr:hypothetical protein SteCoe_38398 [Stentor coeruleus]
MPLIQQPYNPNPPRPFAAQSQFPNQGALFSQKYRETTTKKTTESKNLENAINNSEIMNVKKYLQTFIRKRPTVKITLAAILMKCDSHQDMTKNFNQTQLTWSNLCNFGHKYCLVCIKNYVQSMFPTFNVYNGYECIVCSYNNHRGTLLLTNDQLTYVLTNIYGPEYVKDLLSYRSITRPSDDMLVQIPCSKCNQAKDNLITLCTSNHKICLDCINNWLNNIGTNQLSCPTQGCSGYINTQVLIKAYQNSDLIFKIKDQLFNFGIELNFCFNCNRIVTLSNDSKTDCQNCGKSMCNNCGREAHFGLTCFYFVSQQEYEVIDLPAPADPIRPKSLLEQEYLNAKYAFDNFVNPAQGCKFNKARLIVNKALEKRYSEKKKKMANECGGPDKVNEIYIWHRSRYEHYDAIMKEGFKVDGVDGIPAIQKKPYGYGIYSASTPNTPIGYIYHTKWILACLALKGNKSYAAKEDIYTLNDGKTHSYEPWNDWVVFFTKEQLLPRFLVEYKSD